MRQLFLSRFGRGRGGKFLEARIVPERIEHGIEPEQRRSEPHIAQGTIRRHREYFLQGADGTVGFAHLRCYPSKNLDRSRTQDSVFLNGHHGYGPFCKRQCAHFVTQAHVGKREISNQLKILRLFFEERFQFAARLLPTFLAGRMVAGNFLCPP